MKNEKMQILKFFMGTLIAIGFSSFIFANQTEASGTDLAGAMAGAGAHEGTKKSTDKGEMIVDKGDPVKSCEATRNKAIAECSTPTNQGFKAAAGALAGITGAFAGFSAGDMNASDDQDKIAAQQQKTQQMCMLSQLLSKLADSLNGGQGDTCVEAQQACDKKCNEGITKLQEENAELTKKAMANPSNAQVYTLKINDNKDKIARIEKTNDKCAEEARQIAQKAQQQQQASQAPQQGMDQCQQALNAGNDNGEETVNCLLDKFKSHPSCAGSGGGGGPGLPGYERDPFNIAGPDGNSEFDMPLDDKAFTKTGSGNGNGGGNGNSGPGFFGGSSGSGNDGPANKTGDGTGGGRGIGSLYGGNESGGGGGGWGNMGLDKDGGNLSRLAKKKTDLKVPTKRKLAGHKLGAGEFGLSTDDIWTRVYLRTNTRCTKQLVQCAANRSSDPYGKK